MKKIYILTMIVVMVGISFIACDNKTTTKPSTVEQKQTSVAEVKGDMILSARAPQTFNPLLNTDVLFDQDLKLMYDPLVDIDDSIKPIPSVAQSWKISEIGKDVELKLRGDVYWHDGTKLTADDVIYSLDTIRSAANSLYNKNTKNMLSYQKISDDTVKIIYDKPSGDILYTLYFPIIPKNFNPNTPVGDGKYKFVSYDSMKQINLILNEKYYKKAGSIKNITIKITSDENVDTEAFKQNQIDLLYSEKLNMQKYVDSKKVNAYKYQTLYYDFLGFNFNKSYFKDKKVRQAIAYSINKKEMLDKYYIGLAEITDTPIQPISWLYALPVKKYDYDSGKSASLIKEVMGEAKEKVAVKLLVNEENYQRGNVANAIKNELDKIGFSVTIDKSNMTDYMKKVKTGDYDLLLGGFKLSKFPDLTFMFNSSEVETGKNYAGYKDAKMDLLLEKAFLTFSQDDIKKAYRELQNYINEESPCISLFFRQNVVYTSSKIKGELKPLQWNVFNGIENCSVEGK